MAFISLGIKSQTFWCDVESLFCTQKKPVMKKLQQFGQFSAGHFSIIVKIAVGSRLFFDGLIFKFDLKKIQKRFNLSWCISISVGCYFFICLSFFWGSYRFYWCSILFLGRKYPMVGPIQAHLSWVGRAPHSLGRMAGAGRCQEVRKWGVMVDY